MASNCRRFFTMNKEQVSGKADEAKGKAKVKLGKATNDSATRMGGLKDQVKGKAKGAMGDAKEAVGSERQK